MSQWSWKRFDASSMVLRLYWRNAPDTPTNYDTQETFDRQTGQTVTHCGTSGTPDYVHTNAPQWQATISDRDDQGGNTGGNLNTEFEWTNTTTGTTGTLDADQNSQGQRSGAQFTASRPGSAGDLYKWQAYGTTRPHTDPEGNAVPVLNGPKTFPACFFWADTAAPPAPAVTSDKYTSDQRTQPVGTPGQFTFAVSSGYTDPDLGFNDVAGFKYGIDTAPSVYVPASGLGGTATIPFVPFTTSETDLFVQTVDAAGNPSTGVTEFRIDTLAPTGNIAPLGRWKLNNHGDDSVAGDLAAGLTTLGGAS